MKINEWLENSQPKIYELRPELKCADGFSMSVQASRFHYCFPKEDGDIYYTHVEIGYPSEKVDEFMPFMKGGEGTDPTQTVYGRVPVWIVDAVIEAHGGIFRN